MSGEKREAVVIGSGFGGAISACRLAKCWPGQVTVVERGRSYPMGSFPRSPDEMTKNFWSVGVGDQGAATPDRRGLFDVHTLQGMDVVTAAGLGGGSLVYANVFLEPPPHVFDDDRWPASCSPDALRDHFAAAKAVLGARPVPLDDGPRQVLRRRVFADAAQELGRASHPVEVNVFFGTGPDDLLEPGRQATNAYGATQTSCTYCAECDIGCNIHAKNTLDLNYLHRARDAHGAEILTDHLVVALAPSGPDGQVDPGASGDHGYLVTCRDLDTGATKELWAQRVVVAAGTLGTVELLLRARDIDRTLPKLSAALGKGFSGNGDFLLFVAGIDSLTDPTRGPVITQYTDYGLFDGKESDGFVMEDAGYPTQLAWFVEGAKPNLIKMWASLDFVRSLFHRPSTSAGGAFPALIRHGLSEHSAVLLCMGRDRASGRLELDGGGQLTGTWPVRANRRLYRNIRRAAKAFTKATGGDTWFALPTWWLPKRRNVTVHPLGGCALAGSASEGVVDAHEDRFGEVFEYRNLYVADGSLLPASVGANPSATIAALAERVAQTITGQPPDVDL